MTITDVAGLEALPVGTIFVDASEEPFVVAENSDGERVYCGPFSGVDRTPDFVDLPAEVLSPRTVTPEQVEALWTRHRDAIAPITIRPGDEGRWPDAERRGETYRRGFEAGRDAALAAMGIGVSDG